MERSNARLHVDFLVGSDDGTISIKTISNLLHHSTEGTTIRSDSPEFLLQSLDFRLQVFHNVNRWVLAAACAADHRFMVRGDECTTVATDSHWD